MCLLEERESWRKAKTGTVQRIRAANQANSDNSCGKIRATKKLAARMKRVGSKKSSGFSKGLIFPKDRPSTLKVPWLFTWLRAYSP
jgi:hypothetical protein